MILSRKTLIWVGLIVILMLTGCTRTAPDTATQAVMELNPQGVESMTPQPESTPTGVDMYEPLDASICQMLQQEASAALGLDFTLEESTPFSDFISGERGSGCRLSATATSEQFESPQQVMEALLNSIGLGWNEQLAYQADGVMGTSTGLSRDMALMLIQLNWAPEQGENCPTAQEVDSCSITATKNIYTIQIDIAQYMATFSMDGHWVDASTGFTLDLYQDWKSVFGQHVMVAENGNKIDSLEASIDGMLNGQVATVEFKSSFSDQPGTAEITYVDVNTIHWKIITPPAGEYYLPAEATLNR